MRHLLYSIVLLTGLNSFAQFGEIPSFFNIQREAPLLELNTTTTIAVADYGAVVNDGSDDTIAIQNAINAAVSSASLQNPVRLLFENGTYNIMPNPNNSHALEMTDANGVFWDGQNAEFIIHNGAVGFLSLLRCSNTILKEFSIDYADLPFSQGVITNVDVANGTFDFRVDDGFPFPTTSLFMDAPQRWGMIKNNDGSLKKGSRNLIPHNGFFQSLGNRTFRYSQNTSILNTLAVGDYFVHIARYNGRTLIRNNGGKNLTYLNITGYTSPAGGFNAFNSEEWNVFNCEIKLKEGRVHTLNADAMHVNGGTIAPWVENCLFEAFADDCLNLKYTKREITEINSATQITVVNSVLVGEKMEFYNPRAGTYLGEATVTNVVTLGGNRFRLTLSNPINITTITDPDHQLADKAYIESRSNQSFIFRNNIIRNSRRYGILIQSKYAVIENNLFQNISSSAITIQNGVDWGEGFRSNDIVIDSNTFLNCGFDTSYIEDDNAATIKVDFRKLGQPCTVNQNWCGTETSDFVAQSNITISNNQIIYNKRGLYLKNINGLTVENNFICHSGQDITLAPGEIPVPYVILNSNNTSVEEFDYTLPTANLHYVLNESELNADIENIGSNSNIGIRINNQGGGMISQAFFDSEVGYSINVNTEGNGNLNLFNIDTNQPFPGATGSSARTYAFWVKPQEGIFQTLLTSGGPADGEVFAIQMQANRVVRVTDNNQNIVRMNDMPLDLGVWNHVVVTVPEGGNIFDVSLYKNGLPSNETLSGSNVKINTSASAVNFFSRFKGVISDIRYFDYNLCNGEVERVFNDRYLTLSIDEFGNSNDKISVYPTLAIDTIHFSKPITSIEFFDLLGKKVLSKESSSITNMDISNLQTGFYIIKINKTQTLKILKK